MRNLIRKDIKKMQRVHDMSKNNCYEEPTTLDTRVKYGFKDEQELWIKHRFRRMDCCAPLFGYEATCASELCSHAFGMRIRNLI